MLTKLEGSSGNVVGYKATGKITPEDYDVLVPEVRSLVEDEGAVRLLLDLTDCAGEEVRAWLPDLRFGREFRDDIAKMAVVGDARWHEWIAKLADPFYADEARFFHTADAAEAWAWLRA